jgi:hypothetical protein
VVVASPDRYDTEREMALETKEWQELYEGAREVFGPTGAAIFMKAMEPGLRDDLATKADLADLRAAVESKLRAQTWMMVTVMIAAVGATRFF